ncbi:MAG: bifunctional precorrin-2 dehydrogenase/sirohydrochlorin ferrochelatase [Phycisphaeraceae bacterium]
MPELPIILRPAGWRCVVVGGGAVATRRGRWLRDAGARLVVVAPVIADELAGLAHEAHHRPYQAGDLARARLVITATDDPAVNEQVAHDAREGNILCNRPDRPAASDFTVPAVARRGDVTLAVATGGASPTAARAICDELAEWLDPAWPRLLAIARSYREAMRGRENPSAGRPGDLTDRRALDILKAHGENALRDHLDGLTADGPPRTPGG